MKNLLRLAAALAFLSFALTSSAVATYAEGADASSLLDGGRASAGAASVPAANPPAISPVRVSEAYPLSFEANRGQTDPAVKFLARGSRQTLFLTSTEAVVVFTKTEQAADGGGRKAGSTRAKRDDATGTALRMTFLGANPAPRVVGRDELPGKANYFVGDDPTKWRTNVPTYAKVQYEDIYPGVDLIYYGNQRQLEYDLVVRPGAATDRIVLGFEGADTVEVDTQGDLVLHTAAGVLRQRKPVIYQEVEGRRRVIAGGYIVKGPHRVGFQMAAYDPRRALIIDPVLVYSTYLRGSNFDVGVGIAVDALGNAYVTGRTASTNFPTTPGAFQTTPAGAFVTKINAAGTALVYSTYLGGSGGIDEGLAIAVDAAGNAYVTGVTNSADFPTANAIDSTFNGVYDAFVTKINAAGTALVYSTYLGGSSIDQGLGIAVDAAGNAYVTGVTTSTDFPTANAIDSTFNGESDAFVTKINAAGTALVYSTYLGGSDFDVGRGIAVDAAGNAYITGDTESSDFPTANAIDSTFNGILDAFVTKINSAGTARLYSTYLGGSNFDVGVGIAVDALGNAYVTGITSSTDFPTTPGAFQPTIGSSGGGAGDAFVAKLNPSGSGLVYSTYLGGSGFDEGLAIAVDAAGNAYVTGSTGSTNFPTTPGAFQTIFAGCGMNAGCNGPLFFGGDAFVTKLNPSGSGLVYSTYLGGSDVDSGLGIAVDAGGNAYVTGSTGSTNFPTTPGAFQTTFSGAGSAFVTKIAVCPAPAGSWTPTGSMPTGGGWSPAATRLANGKVLVAGGTSHATGNITGAAAVFDPASGTFAATGPMATPRHNHTATLLPNGKVLVAGGDTEGGTTDSVELYDPALGTFTAGASLLVPRAFHTTTLLPNGKVLMVGGLGPSGGGFPLQSAELYDPAANNGNGASTATASMTDLRAGHTATLLANGKVLVVGGIDGAHFLTSAEIFDPAANNGAGGFALAQGTMTHARTSHAATRLPSGRVLITGGFETNVPPGALAAAEVFDPVSGSFATTGAMIEARALHTATSLADGTVLIAGGGIDAEDFSDTAELFDEAQGRFVATGSMGTARGRHAATLLTNGRVLAAGGLSLGISLNSAELFTPANCAPVNTPVGSDVLVTPRDTTTGGTPVKVTFANVTEAGTTTLTTTTMGPNPPPNFELGNGIFYHIETTATYSGDVTVCIDYSGTSLAGTTTQPTFGHYNSATGLWEVVNVTSWDRGRNMICGTVGSLSPFALLVEPAIHGFGALRASAKIDADEHKFEVRGTFTLSAGSDGIAPHTEDVRVQVGPFSVTIPAGSFRRHGAKEFEFEGRINRVRLEVHFRSLGRGRFEFEVEGKGADLTGTANPVTVGILIGNDGGRTMVTAKFATHRHGREHHDGDRERRD